MAGAVCRRVLVSGRVQGVFYRGWTCREAAELGVRGWVRNLHDGRVEALLCGPAAAVDTLIARMHEGPGAAQVDAVAVEDVPSGEGDDLPRGFTQRPTV